MKDVHAFSETPAYLPVFLYENENLLYNFCQKHAEFLGKISACFLIYITFFLYLLQKKNIYLSVNRNKIRIFDFNLIIPIQLLASYGNRFFTDYQNTAQLP